jgi:hypothetical protein
MEEAETGNRISPEADAVILIAAWDDTRHRIETFGEGRIG